MIFEAGNETRKIWSDFGAEKNLKSQAKREWFLFLRLFLRERKLMSEKFSLSERIFFHVRLLNAVLFQLLMVMKFDYGIVLVLGLFR